MLPSVAHAAPKSKLRHHIETQAGTHVNHPNVTFKLMLLNCLPVPRTLEPSWEVPPSRPFRWGFRPQIFPSWHNCPPSSSQIPGLHSAPIPHTGFSSSRLWWCNHHSCIPLKVDIMKEDKICLPEICYSSRKTRCSELTLLSHILITFPSSAHRILRLLKNVNMIWNSSYLHDCFFSFIEYLALSLSQYSYSLKS